MGHSESRIRAILNSIRRFFKREPDVPEDPYAYVTAPKKPRPPYRSAAAVADKPEDLRSNLVGRSGNGRVDHFDVYVRVVHAESSVVCRSVSALSGSS